MIRDPYDNILPNLSPPTIKKNRNNSSYSQNNIRDPYNNILPNLSPPKIDKNVSLTKALLDQISGQISGTASPPSIDYSSAPVQFITGVGDSFQNLVANLGNLIPGVKLNLAKRAKGWPYEIGKVAGDVETFALGGDIADTARFSAEALPYIGKIAKQLGKGGFSAGVRRALGNAGYGALTNPDDRTQSALTTGILSAALDSTFGALNGLRPSRYFRGELTPQELEERLTAAKGTQTNLGEVIGSPRLKKVFENDLATLPFSGIQGVMQNTAKMIQNKGEQLLSKISGNQNPENLEDIGSSLKDALKISREKALAEKQKLFKKSHDLADEVKASIKSNNISQAASEILKNISGSARNVNELENSVLNELLAHKSGNWPNLLNNESKNEISSFPSSINNLIDSLKDRNPDLHKEIMNVLKNKGSSYSDSLRHANAYHGILNDKISTYENFNKTFLVNIYTQLKKALEKDIKSGIKDTGNTQLQNLNDKALSFYENNWIPHEDPSITSFTKRGGDVDTLISKFINTGRDDRSHLLSKITDKLPDDKKKLLAYGYFKRAIQNDKLNPLEIKKLYQHLGKNQRETLLGSDLNKEMKNYVNLVDMNQEPLSIMANPKTGIRNQDLLALILGHALGGYAGYKAEGIPGSIAGSIAGVAAPGLLTRGIVKPYLTSPTIRENLVRKMQGKNKKNVTLKKGINLLKQSAIDLINDQFTGRKE